MYTLFDQERINELNRLDAEKKLNKLNALLAAAGRMDELVKSFTDKTLQNIARVFLWVFDFSY